MAIELISKIKPKNGGNFAMVDACDVEMPDGSRLSNYKFEAEGSATAELDIFPEQTLEFSAVSDSLYVWQTEGYHRQLSAGETYKLVWGEEEYSCEAFEAALNGVSAVGIGNAAIAGLGDDTGEPFLFGVLADGSATGLYTTSGEASRIVRVYQVLYPAMLPEIGDAHEGKIPQVVDGQLVYTDPASMKVGDVTLETYIGNAVNSYIEEALGGEY